MQTEYHLGVITEHPGQRTHRTGLAKSANHTFGIAGHLQPAQHFHAFEGQGMAGDYIPRNEYIILFMRVVIRWRYRSGNEKYHYHDKLGVSPI